MVRLGRPDATTRPDDLGAAVRNAMTYGQRPAITVLRRSGRQEQGFASLAQWVAKGAHWLELDHLAGPGDRLLLDAPAGWASAAVALAAWWAGVVVTDEPDDVLAAVIHDDRPTPTGIADVLTIGDAFDGSPTAAVAEPAYVLDVQAFPDQPPAPQASADATAMDIDGVERTQRGLIEAAGAWDVDGPIGLATDAPPQLWLPAVAVRPLLTGWASIVLDGVDRDAAAGDGVQQWIDA